MANVEELANAFVTVLAVVKPTPPLKLMNHDPDEIALIIAAIVDRCAAVGLVLMVAGIGTELSEALGLRDGSRLKHGGKPLIRVDPDLGREVVFEIASTPFTG